MPRKQNLIARQSLPDENIQLSAPVEPAEQVVIKQETKKFKQVNPWGSENLEEFLFYCCPECDHKYKNAQSFVDHALLSHVNSNVEMEVVEDEKPEKLHEDDESVDPLSCEMDIVDNIKQEQQPEPTEKLNKKDNSNSQIFECELCEKTFKDKTNLTKHLNNVHNIRKETFHCEQCDNKFATNSGLTRHVKIVHSEDSMALKCDICDHISRSDLEHRSHLHRHMFRQLKDGNFQCIECSLILKPDQNLNTHIHCEICPFASNNTRMDKHMKEVHFIVLKCQECDAEFDCRSDLNRHVKEVHTTDCRSVKCDKCDHVSRNDTEHRNHLHTHRFTKLTNGSYQCNECKKILEPGKKLRLHKHNYCDLCSYSCIRLHQFYNHKYLIHSIPLPSHYTQFKCDTCDYMTLYSGSLKNHQKMVHEGKTEMCFICGKDCKSLYNHIKAMHPSDSMQHQFACDKCPKTFPYASGLKQHVDLVHLKQKSFVCEQCGKGFYTRIQFNEHQALPNCNFMSSTDVIFNCDKCQDTFDTLKGFIRHYQVMHGDFPPNLPKDSTLHTLKCDECPKIFLKQCTLKSHKKKVHQGILARSKNK